MSSFHILLLLSCCGPLVGFLASFFGVGGGMVLVPALYVLFPRLDPQVVIANSLAIVFLNAMIVSWQFYKAGERLHWGTLLGITIPTILFSFGSQWLLPYLSALFIKSFFAIFLYLMTIKSFVFSLPKENHAFFWPTWEDRQQHHFWIKVILAGCFAGSISGMTGLGGGIILVPILTTWLCAPFRRVPFYTNVSMFIAPMAATIMNLFRLPQGGLLSFPDWMNSAQMGLVNGFIILMVLPGSFLGASWGRILAAKTPLKIIEKLFALFTFLVGSKLFYDIFQTYQGV